MMAASMLGKFKHFTRLWTSETLPLCNHIIQYRPGLSVIQNQIRQYAARKGKRMLLKRQKKKKEVEEKIPFPDRMKALKQTKAEFKKRGSKNELKETPLDNVYWFRYYKWPLRSLEEVVAMHRETHHPSMYNQPNALVLANFELDMTTKKKNRSLDNFTSVINLPHKFDYLPPRKVVAFCKTSEDCQKASEAGAYLAGGEEIVKQIQTGAIDTAEFDYAVATPDMLSECVPLRGILKKRYPARHKGSVGEDIETIVKFFISGIEYTTQKDELENEYGSFNIPIGRLEMPIEEVDANLKKIVEEVCIHRSSDLGQFIRNIQITSPPSPEKFIISIEKYIPEQFRAIVEDTDAEEEGDSDDEMKKSAEN